MSWTGSENERKEQGTCRPPAVEPKPAPRFLIPAGTPCSIKRITQATYRQFTTRIITQIERYEEYDRKNKAFVFRKDGFQLSVPARFVVDRNQKSAGQGQPKQRMRLPEGQRNAGSSRSTKPRHQKAVSVLGWRKGKSA